MEYRDSVGAAFVLIIRRALATLHRMTLLAVYDFAVSPTSYDLAPFLALADLHRRRISSTSMHVIFVPAPGDGFWDKENISLDEKRWRLRNLLVPLCSLWPACQGVTVLSARDDARLWLDRMPHDGVFPRGYRLDQPIPDAFQWAAVTAERACGALVPSWVAPPRARDFVRRWLEPRAKSRRVVVITLREAGYYSEVNSNLAAWATFARSLDAKRYFPVILRDTGAIAEPVPHELQELTLFSEASLNVELRAALYAEMFIGLSVANGPMQLQWLNPDCRFLIFRLLVPENIRARPTTMRSLGLEVRGQIPGAMPFQRLIWDEDRPEVIQREFERMVAEIDGIVSPDMPALEPPLRLARRLRETYRLEPARRIYRHLITAGRDRAAARYGMSLLELAIPRRLHIWRYLRAFRHYAAARLLDPKPDGVQVDAAIEIADARLRWRETAAAEAIYRAVLVAAPTQATALHRLGLLALRRGAAAEAIDFISRAVDADPHEASYHFDLAEALRIAGRNGEAADHYRQASMHDPSHQRARDALESLLNQSPVEPHASRFTAR